MAPASMAILTHDLLAALVLDHCETAGGCTSSALRSWVPALRRPVAKQIMLARSAP
jgi:hypothetical protein